MLWMSCLPTASLCLLLLPCFPAQNGGETEQSTDVISVWEGDSISITCSISGLGEHVGMHLKSSRKTVNMIYFPKDSPPNISPDLAGRTECSREGRNYRTTLHSVQESDSNIYLCIEYVTVNDRHKILDGKRTIVVVKAKTGGALKQSPLYASPQQGQSVNITCVMNSPRGDEEIYLLRTHVQPESVLYVSNQNATRILPAFADRLEYSREGKQIVITLHNLQENDSDNYVCAEEVKHVKNTRLLSASGTMVLVKEGEQAYSQKACSHSSWVIYSLLIVVALLFCALVCCTLYRVNIKKYFQKTTPNVVYEDMSYSSRRNTLVRTNTYSKGSEA
ncbi:T-cell antigen CD7 [Neopelma chrysocephalum]|uniref:T-cell antigen CD7 n=1 Tax=Neopelma chrysocephalum TaxID=114329 RepID=UPI000FCD02BA|nr:T-cell antigen CD7 [Neopelma chrysocephalum]